MKQKYKKIIMASIILISVLLVLLAIRIYASSSVLGVNTASNEETLTRLVAGLAKAQYADRLVTMDNVSNKLYTFVGSGDATLADDTDLDAIVVTYTSAGRKYNINKGTSYTITFDANGGTGGPTTQTKPYGERITLTTSQPTREGYTFLGWNTSYNATTALYESGGTYTGNGNVILYAVWELNTYDVIFDPVGGTGAPGTQEKVHGIDLTLSLVKPTKTGHTFRGWDTSSAAATAVYQPGGTFTTNADTTLYAVWTANTYTITYNANGGSGAPGAQTYTYSTTGSITLSTTRPTRSGYNFLGWSLSASSTSSSYTPGQTWSCSNASDYTLYAVWEKAEYTVSYNPNGASGSVLTETAQAGSSIILKPSNTYTAPSGTHFGNWNTNSAGTGTAYSGGATYSSTTDVTLYATWANHTDSCWHEDTYAAGFFNDEGWEGDYYNAYFRCAACGEVVKLWYSTYTDPVTGAVTEIVNDSSYPATHCYTTVQNLVCGGTE